jgi:hypothetical protein
VLVISHCYASVLCSQALRFFSRNEEVDKSEAMRKIAPVRCRHVAAFLVGPDRAAVMCFLAFLDWPTFPAITIPRSVAQGIRL